MLKFLLLKIGDVMSRKYMFLILSVFLYAYGYADNLDNTFCYPNPFSPFQNNGKIHIQYRLSSDAAITVTIYNLIGDVVYTNTYEKGISGISQVGQGTYEILWDGKNSNGRYVADGGYILQIKAEDGKNVVIKHIKIMVIKDR